MMLPSRTPAKGTHVGLAIAISIIAIGASVLAAHAQGAGPFGVGAPEAGAETSAYGIFGWIAAEQAAFYKTLTSALKAFRTNPNASLLLIAVSAAYGIFHAAGPGHGKAVIASYLIANKQTLKRGIGLSFISAFFQGAVAVAFVSVARFIFDVTAVQMTVATEGLELTSALMITALGLWLLVTKVFRLQLFRSSDTSGGDTPGHIHSADCTHALFGDLAPQARGSTVGAMMVCVDCGSTHMPDPAMISGTMDWRKAIGAIVAVGVRPCSGAIFILVFAFSQQMYLAGILSVTAMSIGTGITVSILAGLAVYAKDKAVALAGLDSLWAERIVRTAEIVASLAVLTLGSLLLGATLLGTPAGG